MALPPPPTPNTPAQPAAVADCYRHPDRETGRSCTRCGRAACSECLVQATVGSHCLECAKAARPDIATRARFWNSKQPTLMTYIVIGLNLAVFAWTTLSDPSTLGGRGGVVERAVRPGGQPPGARVRWYLRRPLRRTRAVVPAHHVGLPALRHHPPRLQHVRAVPARPAARANARPSEVHAVVLRVAARWLARRDRPRRRRGSPAARRARSTD